MSQQPWIGVISLDLLKQHVAVYVTDEDRMEGLRSLGVSNPPPVDVPIHGAVTIDTNDEGILVVSLLLEPTGQQDISTWVHESVHVTDIILDYLGFPGSIDNTEIRAYTTQYVFEQIGGILDSHLASLKKKKNKKKQKKHDSCL